jgi:hypothetical protein
MGVYMRITLYTNYFSNTFYQKSKLQNYSMGWVEWSHLEWSLATMRACGVGTHYKTQSMINPLASSDSSSESVHEAGSKGSMAKTWSSSTSLSSSMKA